MIVLQCIHLHFGNDLKTTAACNIRLKLRPPTEHQNHFTEWESYKHICYNKFNNPLQQGHKATDFILWIWENPTACHWLFIYSHYQASLVGPWTNQIAQLAITNKEDINTDNKSFLDRSPLMSLYRMKGTDCFRALLNSCQIFGTVYYHNLLLAVC